MFSLRFKDQVRHIAINDEGALEVVEVYIEALLTEEQVVQIENQYDSLKDLSEAAEKHRKAVQTEEPELVNGRKKFDVLSDEGEPTGETEYYPQWVKFNNAQEIINSASELTKALYRVRSSEYPSQSDIDLILGQNTVSTISIDPLEQFKLAKISEARIYVESLPSLTRHSVGLSAWSEFTDTINSQESTQSVTNVVAHFRSQIENKSE